MAVPTWADDRAEEMVYRLAYVGADYALAVQHRRIVNPFEYREMIRFTKELENGYRREKGAAAPLLGEFVRLRVAVEDREQPAIVEDIVTQLLPKVAEDLNVDLLPVGTIDMRRGAASYEANCASCHGSKGAGDGLAAAGLDPPPRSFLEPTSLPLGEYQAFGAAFFGVDGTAMPSFGESLSREELWDIAFYVVGLRGAHPPARERTTNGQSTLLHLEDAFVAVAESVAPAVVGVLAHRRTGEEVAPNGWRLAVADLPPPGYRRVAEGSGFVVDADGWILARRSAAIDPETEQVADLVLVELHGHTYDKARVVSLEPTLDLAVLKVEPTVGLAATQSAPAGDLRVGQWAIALGDPPGAKTIFAVGNISGTPYRGCYQADLGPTLVQTSLFLDPGGFGGPLVDVEGRVIGMLAPPPFAREGESPVPAFALPIDLAMTVFAALRESEARRSPWLGFAVRTISRGLRGRLAGVPGVGVHIDNVHDPSPAAGAGIEVDDILVSFDGDRMVSVAAFQRALYRAGIGREVELELVRGGTPLRKRLTVEERPAEYAPRS